MKPSVLFVGIILGILVLVGGTTLMGLLGVEPDPSTPDYAALNASLAQVREIQIQTEQWQRGLNATSEGELTGLDNLVQTSWNTLKSLPSIFTFVNSMMIHIAAMLGLGGYADILIILLYSAIITSVIFAIWAAIFQKDL